MALTISSSLSIRLYTGAISTFSGVGKESPAIVLWRAPIRVSIGLKSTLAAFAGAGIPLIAASRPERRFSTPSRLGAAGGFGSEAILDSSPFNCLSIGERSVFAPDSPLRELSIAENLGE